MTWDFAEAGIFSDAAGNYARCIGAVTEVLDRLHPSTAIGEAHQADASRLAPSTPLIFSTDPPYYDNVGYADLSDYFYEGYPKPCSY
jgi:putative DNA methylase